MSSDCNPLVLRPNDKIGKQVTLQFMTETIGAPHGCIRIAWKANNHANLEFDGNRAKKINKLSLCSSLMILLQLMRISDVQEANLTEAGASNFTSRSSAQHGY